MTRKRGLTAALLLGVFAVLAGGIAIVRWPVPAQERLQLSAEARQGEAIFLQHCALCHGAAAQGSEQGPPLVHQLYHPGHHGDQAFYRAAGQGVPQHHWNFGPMPAVAGVKEAEIALILRYVRELQRAEGIF